MSFIKRNKFSSGIRTKFPTVSGVTLNILLPFCAMHLREVPFSALGDYEIIMPTNSEKSLKMRSLSQHQIFIHDLIFYIKENKHFCLVGMQFCSYC